jgi:hypothetical protein
LQGERCSNKLFDAEIVNEFFEKEHIPMDVDKSTTNDPILE